MSDGLTATPTHDAVDASAPRPRRPARVVVCTQAAAILAAYVVAGLLAGGLWFRIWDQPDGVVSGGEWFTSEAGLRAEFAGVAWYVSIATLAGLVLGALSAWLLARSELATLAAVLVGSVLAAFLMLRLGQHLSAADPHELAKTAKDGTRLKGALQVRAWTPRGAFPFGSLVALAVVFSATSGRVPAEPGRADSAAPRGTQG